MSIEMEPENSKDTNESRPEQNIDDVIDYFRDSNSLISIPSEEEKCKAKQDMLRRIELRRIKREQMKKDGKVPTKHDKLF